MKLLVVVLCLLSERFLMHAISYRRFIWFPAYCNKIQQGFANISLIKNPWILLLILILPLVLATALIYGLLHGIAFGFVGLVFSVLIFLYCLGPNNVFYPITLAVDEMDNTAQISNYLADANTQLFAPLFWYILGGPIAVLIYRLIESCSEIIAVREKAVLLTNLLEWVPARLTAILYLLVGNFQNGFVAFRQYVLAKPSLNKALLSECGLKAIRTTDAQEIPMPMAENLVEHATIVVLVLIALFTLDAWL